MSNFYTDVIEKDSRFHSVDAVTDVALLEPKTRAAVAAIIAEARIEGVQLMSFETYRSQERQEKLFRKGTTKLRNVGVHHFGLACDIVRDVGGKPSWKGDFTIVGRLAKKHGLIWGGDWGEPGRHHSFVDVVHVQRCRVADQNALFAGAWYPDDAYDPTSAKPEITIDTFDPDKTMEQPIADVKTLIIERPHEE